MYFKALLTSLELASLALALHIPVLDNHLSINIEYAPGAASTTQKVIQPAGEACNQKCWAWEPTCSGDQYKKNFGSDARPCWTCCWETTMGEPEPMPDQQCVGDSDALTKSRYNRPAYNIPRPVDVLLGSECMRNCYFDNRHCPAGFVPKLSKDGQCWYCCIDTDE
ncbi:hypothetical protein BJ508DRAFT_358107 [Ascobolus immersus RN42]|uniref:Uncharacterized protein n=1 Tax=Ascobolus immersus RN42 TaxID=1160509 RepID=A0A3N4IKV0_ASCIM|nr:hypothetical protein BJ508DRAFT_358107 [Ascobolus immersus RN42]